MRYLTIALFLPLALPAFAQSQSCRGKQAFDLGDGAKGCIVEIDEGSITTTRSRDDGASTSSRTRVTPYVAALMSGAYTEKRSVIKRRMISICKVALDDVKKQFAGKKFNRVILYMDWRDSGGNLQKGFSSNTCSGFRFFVS